MKRFTLGLIAVGAFLVSAGGAADAHEPIVCGRSLYSAYSSGTYGSYERPYYGSDYSSSSTGWSGHSIHSAPSTHFGNGWGHHTTTHSASGFGGSYNHGGRRW